MRHIISILVENESGALSRIAGLFSARGYNIESLSVAPTDDSSLSRLTLVTRGSDAIIEQITKQLHKLVDVVKLQDLTRGNHIEREFMFVKVSAIGNEKRSEIKQMVDIFRARFIDVTESTFTIEITGKSGKLDAFVSTLNSADIIEVVRSGSMAISRGSKALTL